MQAQELFIQWKEQYVTEQKTTIKTVYKTMEIEKQLSWWQKLWIAIGKIGLVIGFIWLITKISWRSLLKLLGL